MTNENGQNQRNLGIECPDILLASFALSNPFDPVMGWILPQANCPSFCNPPDDCGCVPIAHPNQWMAGGLASQNGRQFDRRPGDGDE